MDFSLFEADKLYVLGNGFDLHHNVPSCYGNFRDFLQRDFPEVYNLLIKLYGDLGDVWWRTFEESLANFDPDKYPKDVVRKPFFNTLNDFRKKYGDDVCHKFDDYENQYPEDLSKPYIRASLIAEIEMNILKQKLSYAFGEWVKDLPKPDESLMVKDLNKDALFFTFNYTRTLEDLYGIDEDQVVHLHGSIDRGIFEFGHNKTFEEMIEQDLDKHAYERNPLLDKGEDEARTAMFQVVEELKKPVDEIIDEHSNDFNKLEGLKEMEILGMSYSPIDLPYLERIIEVTGKDIKVILGWHSDEDKVNAEAFAKKAKLTDYELKDF